MQPFTLPLAALTVCSLCLFVWGGLFCSWEGFRFLFLYELAGIHSKGLLIMMEFTCFGRSLWWGLLVKCFSQFMVYISSFPLIWFLCKLAVARFCLVSACSCTSSEVRGCSEPIPSWRWQLVSKACFKRSCAKLLKMCEFWSLLKCFLPLSTAPVLSSNPFKHFVILLKNTNKFLLICCLLVSLWEITLTLHLRKSCLIYWGFRDVRLSGGSQPCSHVPFARRKLDFTLNI